MTVERARARRKAEQVIRAVIDDIRTDDVMRYAGVARQYDAALNDILIQIEAARIDIKWSK